MSQHDPHHGEQGYVLMATTVFALVFTVAGFAFFAMASYETKAAVHRQASSEAFYVADGAVERARAKFLEDRTWRAGWSGESLGHGTYDLTVVDTTYAGDPNVVKIRATGTVRDATRRIEILAKLPPTAFGVPVLVRGDADVNGNLCLSGDAHIEGDADLGPHDSHLVCGDYTSGFNVNPPVVYTDPGHFPDATYYYVRGNKSGGIYNAHIFDENGVDITAALHDSLADVTQYNSGQKTFVYNFDNQNIIDHYFDDATGVFKRNPGDVAVVVNFGETPLVSPPGIEGVSEIKIDSGPVRTIHTTIVNSRFTGVTTAQRMDDAYWTGGLMHIKHATFEPYYGIGIVTENFQKEGGSNVQVGTEAWPAYLYITGDVEGLTSNFNLVGAVTVLGNWKSNGDTDITFDGGFIPNLPGYLMEEWDYGVSGTLTVLRWRELSASGT